MRRLRRTARPEASPDKGWTRAGAAGVTDHLRGSTAPRLRLEGRGLSLPAPFEGPRNEAISGARSFNIAVAGRREAAHKKSDAGSRCSAVLMFDTSRGRAAKSSGARERPSVALPREAR